MASKRKTSSKETPTDYKGQKLSRYFPVTSKVRQNHNYSKTEESNRNPRTSLCSKTFLKNVSLYILSAGIPKVRKDLFASKVVQFGGVILNEFDLGKCSHVLVSETMTLDRALKLLKIEETSCGLAIVSTLWLSGCLKKESLLPADEFLLNLPRATEEPSDSVKEVPDHSDIISDPPLKLLLDEPPPFVTTQEEKNTFIKEEDHQVRNEANNNEDYIDNSQIDFETNSKVSTQTVPKGRWVCFESSRNSPVNYNRHITDTLEEMVKTYKSTNDKWRVYSYQKAIGILKREPKEITSREEARNLRGIGDSLADKIWEIIQSGRLRKLDEFQSSEQLQVLNLLTNVWGAGPHTAKLWYQQGYRSLKDLEEKADLTKQQKVGLRYYDDFLERMSREEVAAIERIVSENTQKVVAGSIVQVCGSYRRGKETCGDIDILISHPDGESHQGLLSRLLSQLKEIKFITDDLIEIEENGSQRKYMGVCLSPLSPDRHRRIDIIVAPYSEYACALVHFTGSAHLNRSIRHLAKTKGMSLSEHALRTGVVRGSTEKLYKGNVLPTPTEQSIFDQLGVPYRRPEERDH
ncbi:DNA polymerase lambda-like [Octopus sinensis]|uniref:DNA polymerase n=1 Tax=Octopus sinensis TaxID=2607531 RepID=A0A6P7TEA4_9MOLL|nr:DNA polymerase lambda-like [Octopus sinensis]